ncbi:MAG: hypothetical protein HQL31_13770 [Planctomycetes bacterium]|nr:hypothetical protein [Planctomycetota bacterium]
MKITKNGVCRFWAFINGSYCRLEVREGKKLNWSKYQTTDEGWNLEYETYYIEDDALILECGRKGRDCDGGYADHIKMRATEMVQREELKFGHPDGPVPTGNIYLKPDFKTEKHKVYDEYAIAAGY